MPIINPDKEVKMTPFKCEFCKKHFGNKGALMSHDKWCNPDNKEWQESLRNKRSVMSKGKGNSMYGRKHTEETKRLISKKAKGRKSPMGFKGKYHTEETKRKVSKILSIKHKGINNPFYGKRHTEELKIFLSERMKGDKNPLKDPEIKKRHKEAVNTPEFKDKVRERMTGINNPNWNPDRGQVFAPYTELFYNHDFRKLIKAFQQNRDLLTGELLIKYPQLHHFNKNKKDNSHFIKGDNYCNVGFLNNNNHGKCDKNKKRFDNYKDILTKNTIILKKGTLPKNWRINTINQKMILEYC